MFTKSIRMVFITLVGVFGLTVTSAAYAAKVDVCHVNSANDVFPAGNITLAFGRVISVSENAAEQHIANHGDALLFGPFTPDLRDILEGILGITLPNADCLFIVATP